MSLLPPCRVVLRLHIRRANFVAAIWKRATEAIIDVPPVTTSGWREDGLIHWIGEAFPSEIEDILLDDEFDAQDYECGGECESEGEN